LKPFGGVGASGVGFYRSKYGFHQFSHLRSVTETPTWGFLEKMLAARYPPYTPDKMKKMSNLVGHSSLPFTRDEGSADHHGIPGWVYAVGVGIVGSIAGLFYSHRQKL
jgi:hypothetical protein